MTDTHGPAYCFVHLGLLVTGEGERQSLQRLFDALTECGRCTFEVIRKVEQLSPRATALQPQIGVPPRKVLTKRQEQIGAAARAYLDRGPDRFVVLTDDLEWDRRDKHEALLDLYRDALQSICRSRAHRTAVHFLVMMLEAYFLADGEAMLAALGDVVVSLDGDVESIRNPKNELKRVYPGYREVEDGARLLADLDLERVLSDPNTCASLRSLIKWCAAATEEPFGDRFRLADGKCCPITSPQIRQLCDGLAAERQQRVP